jgi:hypothetical protein
MAHEDTRGQQYEAPCIEVRSHIDGPLVALVASVQLSSAAFRPVSDNVYEPPRIEERTDIDLPLIGLPSTGAGVCASFSSH